VTTSGEYLYNTYVM